MLARNLQMKNLDEYINDSGYWFEQKFDGKRLLLRITDGEVEAVNRKGVTPGDAHLLGALRKLRAALAHLEGEWCFDGEWMEGQDQFWIFDMPYALDLIGPETPYQDRREALEAVFEKAFVDEPTFRLSEVARTGEEKRALLEWCRNNDSEGIMVKARHGHYHPGKRTSVMMKAKFWQTADVLIGEVGREGKLSCSVWAIHKGDLTDVGSIKMTEKNLEMAQTGMVVEVKYLYFTNDLRLYGPCTFLKWRDDKDPNECTTDDFVYVNKSIRELERTLTKG